ncbi:MAG TPA: response regulator [Acidobacteriota bacterium]|nr:response regulator [Acidobacteriota bacterium]
MEKSTSEETPYRILLVDDDPTNLQILHQVLGGRGYKLIIAKSGEDALKIAERMKPHLVLLDIMMPGIDGYETCKRLKENPETSNAAIIFLSAMDNPEDQKKGLEMGAIDFIQKPFESDHVIATVQTYFTTHKQKAEAKNS